MREHTCSETFRLIRKRDVEYLKVQQEEDSCKRLEEALEAARDRLSGTKNSFELLDALLKRIEAELPEED